MSNESTSFSREYNPPIKVDEVEDVLVEKISLIAGLLRMRGWDSKEIKSIDIVFKTPFEAPLENKAENDSEFKLRQIRNYEMTFGAHEGSRLDDIPISYLEYMHEAIRELHSKLNFYLNHPIIKVERDG